RLHRSLIHKVSGHRDAAAELNTVLASVTPPGAEPPVIVTRYYMQAGLYCFYLPGHPPIRTAAKYLGKRSSTFAQWQDTRMDDPAIYGRTLLLVGEGDVPWDKALIFDELQRIGNGSYFLAQNYRGPRPDHP